MKDEEGGQIRKQEKRLCTNGVSGEERVGRGDDLIYRNERKERRGRNTYLG